MKVFSFVILTICFASLMALATFGQDIQTKGSIKGTITDPNGAAVSGASVKVTGPTGERTTTTNADGVYEVTNLTPGQYEVRIEQSGFKAIVASNQTVYVGKATQVNGKLEVGATSAIVEVTAGAGIDQTRTAVDTNLNDQLFQNIPVARAVSGLFYLAPGASDGLGGGSDNPSISGGSALDNLYVADGVNITNSAFGGIGTFSRSYGALGTGINTAFVKEVQVKTGGFEPQYGQSTGGIVNIITQSGGNSFHGSVYGYARPDAFEAAYKQRDAFSVNKVGELLAREGYDAGVDVGGPIIKDKLFFFGSFNPSVRRDLVQGASGSGIRTLLGEHVQRYRTLNYAGKIDWNIVNNHSVTFSIFGDPTKTNLSSFSTLNIDNLTSLSKLDYGSRNMSLRYNGALSSSWTISASYGLNNNKFDETGYDNFNQIVDRTNPVRGNFTAIGRGFVEPTKGSTHNFTIDTNKTLKFFGQHSVGVGYAFQRSFYSGTRDRSGPHYTIPAANHDGVPIGDLTGDQSVAGQTVNAAWSLRIASDSCTLCPYYFRPGLATPVRVYLRQDRGEYGNPVFDTKADYQAAYVQDTYRINRFVTALFGIRWEQERAIGSPGSSGQRVGYSFTGQWAPRLGVTVDPFGKGKTKAYYNFGRFFEYLPLDLAERSLSAEQDFTGGRFAPAFTNCNISINGTPTATICVVPNQYNTVTPVFDAAHLLTGAAGGTGTGIGISANDPGNPILPGTKLGFLDEHVVGIEQQLPKNFYFTARYINRNLKRVVEDAAVVSPEQFNAGLFGQTYFLANVSASLDAAINPISHVFTPTFDVDGNVTNWPTACGPVDPETSSPLYGAVVTNPRNEDQVLGAVCYNPVANAGGLGSDGVPDGFPNPVHNYRALEIELNKRFSNNWQVLANYRLASLTGNYEGHLRNDNGQTDPGISSLFDFVAGDFNLLGDQFATGPLNSDRRHVINVFGSYSFGEKSFMGSRLKGLNLGFNFHSESGLPISEFLAHPAYLNAGEIPVGGRGKLGRTPWYNRVDLHFDYPWNFTERMRLKFVADLFNITNSRRVRQFNEFRETSLGSDNPDFLKPRNFYAPFNLRLGMRFEF